MVIDPVDRAAWERYLCAPGLSRGEAGKRILYAYAAGLDRRTISHWLRCSPGHVSNLASAARGRVDTPHLRRNR